MKKFLLLAALAVPAAVHATHPSLPAAAVKAPARAGPMLLQPGDLKWNDVPEMGPGMQVAVLRGDPDKAGSHFTLRAKFPDGFKVPPHWHPMEENFVVLQGTFLLGVGEKWDDGKLTAMPQGGYVSMPRGVRHFARAKGETVLELTAIGPFKTMWVDPPKKK